MFGWKRVGVVSDTSVIYREQSRKVLSELRLINLTLFYYYTLSFNSRKDSCASNKLKNMLKTIKDEVQILIIYTYGYTLENLHFF